MSEPIHGPALTIIAIAAIVAIVGLVIIFTSFGQQELLTGEAKARARISPQTAGTATAARQPSLPRSQIPSTTAAQVPVSPTVPTTAAASSDAISGQQPTSAQGQTYTTPTQIAATDTTQQANVNAPQPQILIQPNTKIKFNNDEKSISFLIADKSFQNDIADYRIYFSKDNQNWKEITQIRPYNATIFAINTAHDIIWDIGKDITQSGNYFLKLNIVDKQGLSGEDIKPFQAENQGETTPPAPETPETTKVTKKDCKCVQMFIKSTGQADGGLYYPPEVRSPKPGVNSDPKALGPVDGTWERLIPDKNNPLRNTRVVSYNFEVHSVVEGEIAQCWEFQEIKTTAEIGSTKSHLNKSPVQENGELGFLEMTTDGKYPFQGPENDGGKDSFTGDDYSKPRDDFGGIYKEHLPIQGSNQTIVHWIDSPAQMPKKTVVSTKVKDRFHAQVGGPGGVCDCYWSVEHNIDGRGRANPAPRLYDVVCSGGG